MRKIAQWLRHSPRGPWRQHHRPDSESDDPLLSSGDSPGLERYRQAKASLAELELEERRGVLVRVDKVRDILGRWASLIRRLGEHLLKRFGADALQSLRETLEQCDRLKDEFATPDEATD